MATHRLTLPLLTLSLLLSANALAQEPRVSLSLKGGLNAESSEDNLHGTTPALGLTASIRLAHGWRGETEFWLPGYIEDANGPKHRDIQFGFAAVKTFTTGRVQPFVLIGTTITRTQDWFTFCTANRIVDPGGVPGPVFVSCDEPDIVDRRRERNDGTDGYLLVGGGLEIPLTRRLSAIGDVRLSLAPVSVIVRPGLGLVLRF